MPGDPNFANVGVLLHMDGTNGSTTFTDSSSNAFPFTATNATITTTTPKFGTGSQQQGASGDAFIQGTTTAGASALNLGTGQFTIEGLGWTTTSGVQQSLITNFGTPNFGFFLGLDSGVVKFVFSASLISLSASFTPTASTWYAYAVDRDASNVIRLYVNGSVLASTTDASSVTTAAVKLLIGERGDLASPWRGKIDEVRITKGIARYAGAYTPAIAAFPDSAGTVGQSQGFFLGMA